MSNPETVQALRQSPLAVELNDAEIEVLAAVIQVREFADGAVMVEEGSVEAELYVVVSGAVSVAKRTADGDWNVLHLLRNGDLVGELSFMDGEPRYSNLVAAGTTRVLVLRRDQLEGLIESHPRLVYHVMRAIMRVAHRIQRRLSAQMLEMQHYLYRPGAKYV